MPFLGRTLCRGPTNIFISISQKKDQSNLYEIYAALIVRKNSHNLRVLVCKILAWKSDQVQVDFSFQAIVVFESSEL